MAYQNWLNNDGLNLQYGPSKSIPAMGGDYVMYGPWRSTEVIISLGAASFGLPAGANNLNALPSSFQGTVASQTAAANTGIVSYTNFFPLQATAPVTVANSSGVFTTSSPQLWISQVDFETLVAAANGGGSGTGLTGIGLVCALPVTLAGGAAAWAQITPNAGVQLLGAATNAKMALGMHYTIYADGSIFGTGGVTTANQPVVGSWMGNVPLTTLSETMLPGSLPNNAYISAIVSGGQYTQSGAGGLVRLEVRWRQLYTINDASQI